MLQKTVISVTKKYERHNRHIHPGSRITIKSVKHTHTCLLMWEMLFFLINPFNLHCFLQIVSSQTRWWWWKGLPNANTPSFSHLFSPLGAEGRPDKTNFLNDSSINRSVFLPFTAAFVYELSNFPLVANKFKKNAPAFLATGGCGKLGKKPPQHTNFYIHTQSLWDHTTFSTP